jgi:hypothetical protein
MGVTFVLIVAATVATGLLSGASLDQSIKQLPARHRIGTVAFSQYSRASDLAQGVLFYGILGIGAAILCIAAAIAATFEGVASQRAIPIYSSAVLALLHSLATTRAAPINLRQRQVPADDALALAGIFDAFSRWQTVRCILQIINFGTSFWALTAYLQGP